MNFLAHARLSFNHPSIVTGNMISDFVKGRHQYDYPDAIHKGILLHRAIDNFTDTHAATRQLKEIFRPQYRLYAGTFADVVYDHFLANDTTEFPGSNELKKFAAGTYQVLEDNFEVLPAGFKRMLPYMKQQDWFYMYSTRQGIQNSFNGLVRRSRYLLESDGAFELFNRHYPTMQSLYSIFYPDVKKFAAHHLEELLNA
ncbi:acyl carrier protein phosphodiesterase [Ferruginibacter sp.]